MLKENNMANMDAFSLREKNLSMVKEKIMENMDDFFFVEKRIIYGEGKNHGKYG
jgi:hypothetical protein